MCSSWSNPFSLSPYLRPQMTYIRTHQPLYPLYVFILIVVLPKACAVVDIAGRIPLRPMLTYTTRTYPYVAQHRPANCGGLVLVGSFPHLSEVQNRLTVLNDLFSSETSYGEYTMAQEHVDALWDAFVSRCACACVCARVRVMCVRAC